MNQPSQPEKDHPLEDVSRMAAGRASAEERRRAVKHLLAGCPVCARRLASELRAPVEPPAAAELDAAIERAISRLPSALGRERRERTTAEDLVDDLDDQPPGRRHMILANSRRYRRPAVAKVLMARSAALLHGDPASALDQARQALTVADQLAGPGAYELRELAHQELQRARRAAEGAPAAGGSHREPGPFSARRRPAAARRPVAPGI